ncbi:hypothetical protein GZH53_09315 [Flavihumibacter sp. R14]|nr:hypothetical protein [Flavihumibacter soli]
MKIFVANLVKLGLTILILFPVTLKAQTEQDALMMGKQRLCVAGSYAYNSWEEYWEGTFKRNNDNIGKLSTQTGMLMLNYGISNDLNIMASLPYMSTKATRGTLSGLHGFQDFSVFVKWRPLKKQFGNQTVALLGVAGYSAPTNDYNIDFMPMTVGLGSKVLSGRLIADYKYKKIFATISAAYMHRGNVEIDRPAYYTDRQINSSMVKMPDAGNFQLRTGYRTSHNIAELFIDNMTSFGGFDIRKNDMPFVSNEMNSTRLGIEGKHYLNNLPSLGFHANVWTTVSGRNVGKATGFLAGIDYIIDFNSSKAK